MKLHRLACALLLASCEATEGDLLRALPPPDMARTPECTTDVVQEGGRCLSDQDWKALAMRLCHNRDQGLTHVLPFETCGAGMSRAAKYVCCPRMPQGTCQPETQGSPSSCKGEREWRQAAMVSCGASQLVPTNLMLVEPCDMSAFRYARYLCCPPSPPIR